MKPLEEEDDFEMITPRRRVPRRSRFDIKYFFPDGASLRWISDQSRALSGVEMSRELRKAADVIDASVAIRNQAKLSSSSPTGKPRT